MLLIPGTPSEFIALGPVELHLVERVLNATTNQGRWSDDGICPLATQTDSVVVLFISAMPHTQLVVM